MEIRPYVGATLAANRAHKPRLDVRQPDVIGPGIAADRKGAYRKHEKKERDDDRRLCCSGVGTKNCSGGRPAVQDVSAGNGQRRPSPADKAPSTCAATPTAPG